MHFCNYFSTSINWSFFWHNIHCSETSQSYQDMIQKCSVILLIIVPIFTKVPTNKYAINALQKKVTNQLTQPA
ncbi:hypothetical protein X975_11818, partial [Stegodyphus mimosarum]